MTATIQISLPKPSTHLPADYQTPERIGAKLRAVPLPPLKGKRVLDVGCDMGAWSFFAAEHGAEYVQGLDRNRSVRHCGPVDLVALNRAEAKRRGLPGCWFDHIDLGRQWHEFGAYDVVLVMSVYHHIYENCGSHEAVWLWLARHCMPDGVLLWEGPVDDSDAVVRANVSRENREGYTRDEILRAASSWFTAERIGPALHETTREVWRFTRKHDIPRPIKAQVIAGAGGAALAFNYANGQRRQEIEHLLGFFPYPGSLNLACMSPFWHGRRGYRAQLPDLVDRSRGFHSEWSPRWARFIPVTVNGHPAFSFRFEGEHYKQDFVELIARTRLRDVLPADGVVTLTDASSSAVRDASSTRTSC